MLGAIEREAFDSIPQGLFTRGYLRAYAREVGVDPDAIVARFRELFDRRPVSLEGEGNAASEAKADVTERIDPDEPSHGSRHAEVLQIAVIAVIVIGYFAWQRPTRSAAESNREPPDQAVAVAPAATPIGTTGARDGGPAALTVEIRAEGPCWVETATDGDRQVGRLMKAGERQALRVRDVLALHIGDPSTFAFSIDGVPGRTLGRPGVPVRVQIDRQNYSSLLAPRDQTAHSTQ